MRVLTGDVINTAAFTNKNDFFQIGGHAPELIQDSRLSRVGWLTYSSDISAEMYSEAMYGASLYGSIVLLSTALVLEFDAGRDVHFDTLGLANHNMNSLNAIIEWGSTVGTYPNVATIGPLATDSEAIYNVFLSAPATGRYIRMTFNNPSETGILKIGRLMLGVNQDLPDYRTVYDSIIESSSLANFSNTRQLYGTRKTTWRRLGFEWAPGDIREVVQTLMKTLDRHQATLWTFEEFCQTEETIYAHIDDNSLGLVTDEARLYSGRINISEVK
jgi:hypothetical protein